MHRITLHNKNHPDQNGNSANIEKSCSRTIPNATNQTILPYFTLIFKKNKTKTTCQTSLPQALKLASYEKQLAWCVTLSNLF